MSEFKTPAVSRRRMEELTAGAKHARSRYDLYKAQSYSARPSSPAKLRELKRDAELAQMRLIRAKSDA